MSPVRLRVRLFGDVRRSILVGVASKRRLSTHGLRGALSRRCGTLCAVPVVPCAQWRPCGVPLARGWQRCVHSCLSASLAVRAERAKGGG